ncbi:MAG: nitroreductase family protein [Candidatus Bipolaricaulota bacterium]|nr:nitroreductase family protein [Candidatus Bipolaricaulota bacterium]
MNIYQAIGARRTIRDFEPRAIERAVLDRILGAGLRAPMHDPKDGRRFVLVEDAAVRAELVRGFWRERTHEETAAVVDSWELESPEQRAMFLDALPKQAAMLLSAGALVIVCFRQTEPLLEAKGSLHELNAFAEVWSCLENILVAAAAEGIFGVTKIPSTPAETQHIRGTLGMPNEYEAACYLALGYSKPGAPSFAPSIGEVGGYTFRNAWGQAQP